MQEEGTKKDNKTLFTKKEEVYSKGYGKSNKSGENIGERAQEEADRLAEKTQEKGDRLEKKVYEGFNKGTDQSSGFDQHRTDKTKTTECSTKKMGGEFCATTEHKPKEGGE
jgi:hypothetical protein